MICPGLMYQHLFLTNDLFFGPAYARTPPLNARSCPFKSLPSHKIYPWHKFSGTYQPRFIFQVHVKKGEPFRRSFYPVFY